MRLVAAQAVRVPSAFGTSLALMSRLAAEAEQLVVVLPDGAEGRESAGSASDLVSAARRHNAALVAFATEGQAETLAADGFTLFEGRATRDGLPTAYLCREFVCRLPATTPQELSAARGT
jgi:uncharacterized protein YyaL (SSP411 family)